MKWTEEDINFLSNFYPKKGRNYCSKALNRTVTSIADKAKHLKLKVEKDIVIHNMSKNLLCINDYIYVNDKKIAYILGLIWTDGGVYLSNNKNKTPIVRHSCIEKDSNIINSLFKQLNWRHYYSNNVKSWGKNNMSINWISNKELGLYLINNNFKDKNLGTKIYDNFNKNVVSHFIRGIFDGDGCFSIYINKNKYKNFNISLSSTYHQNWEFITSILDNLNVKTKVRKCIDSRGKSSQLIIIDSTSIYNFCKFIYLDSSDSRLERKYEKFSEFLEYKKIHKRDYILEEYLNNNL